MTTKTGRFRVDAYTDYRGGWKSEFAETAAEALDAHTRLKARWKRSMEVVALRETPVRSVPLSELRKMAKDA